MLSVLRVLCGMNFQETSQMYHCLNCDALSDFSELDPRNEEMDDLAMNDKECTASK